MGNPKIDLPLQPLDKALNLVCVVGLLALFIIPWYYYAQLPETIPNHFGTSGDPDRYGQKKYIWTLPIIGLMVFLLMTFINKYPHKFNYLQKITEKNAHRQYSLATRMIRILNVFTILLFLHLVYKSIQIALGNATGLGSFSMTLFFLFLLGFTMYSFSQSTKKEEA